MREVKSDVDAAHKFIFLNGCAIPVLPPSKVVLNTTTRISLGIGDSTPVFGILASVNLVSLRCVGLWLQLAQRVPSAVFMLHPMDANDLIPMRRILVAGGIDTARIFSIPDGMDHGVGSVREIALTGLVDIILDSVPMNDYASVRAGLTQGIPVVSMSGQMPYERLGMTIFKHLGLESMIAQSGREYVDVAAELATNPVERKNCSARMLECWASQSGEGMPFSIEAYCGRIVEASALAATPLVLGLSVPTLAQTAPTSLARPKAVIWVDA